LIATSLGNQLLAAEAQLGSAIGAEIGIVTEVKTAIVTGTRIEIGRGTKRGLDGRAALVAGVDDGIEAEIGRRGRGAAAHI
jgi:hypothetical protein